MKKLKQINLEIGKPTVEIAMKRFKNELKKAKDFDIGCFLVIHGYGSHGKGGVIREHFREYINDLKDKKLIKTFVYGENFKIIDREAYRLKQLYSELEYLFHMTNKGVTVVELN